MLMFAHSFATSSWLALFILVAASPSAWSQSLGDAIEREAQAVEAQMIAWRRDIHQNPELGNREVWTSALVAAHLKKLGYEVRDKIAITGVVGILKGGKPGPVVALRADMDALPVTEEVDLPFASKVKVTWNGRETGVMHACGHDAHTAILMAAADVFAKLRDQLPGTIKLIFQPAEDGLPIGEEGGAQLMIKEGVLENPKPEAVFGLHVTSGLNIGMLAYRAGAAMAGSDTFRIIVKRSANAWRPTLARHRPDRDRRADRACAADDPEPTGRRHEGTVSVDHRCLQWGQPAEHHPRQGRDARYIAYVRSGNARFHHTTREGDHGGDRSERWSRSYRGVEGRRVYPACQQRGIDAANGADAQASGWCRQGATDHRVGRLFFLCEAGARVILPCRHYAVWGGTAQGSVQSLAAVSDRRGWATHRSAIHPPCHVRLHEQLNKESHGLGRELINA